MKTLLTLLTLLFLFVAGTLWGQIYERDTLQAGDTLMVYYNVQNAMYLKITVVDTSASVSNQDTIQLYHISYEAIDTGKIGNRGKIVLFADTVRIAVRNLRTYTDQPIMFNGGIKQVSYLVLMPYPRFILLRRSNVSDVGRKTFITIEPLK